MEKELILAALLLRNELEKEEEVSKHIKEKAMQLKHLVKIDYVTFDKICFKIEELEKTHYIYYFFKKKSWWCDCEWFALHSKTCSHIYAVKLRLKEILSKIKE